ncbi:MAG: bifunctional 3-deoxy-7-phosphoheptulonate synthase/chorismate mutase type II [Bacteroidia bacterium]|nr:bifunctional 3-deoxy-7-phosphoheptulonate synthase/chorismate mutase type II [Bacteroidia bacterium]
MQTDSQPKDLQNKYTSRPGILIAGPCSAETELQILNVAEALSKTGVDYMRAGIWKPRTSPGHFEGIGTQGLKWLQTASKQYGIKVATEVATAKHVEEALEHGIDMLWVGARTTVNPFAVQEIADALQGVKIPVMVKNPVNPDLSLWMGAIKRLMNAGLSTIIACHRGFNVYQKTLLRNAPLWEIPIELKRLMPEIPLICDPSHICGNRESLLKIAQKSMDLGYEGLILEVHPNPDKAWSDAAQQVTPEGFMQLLSQLRYKKQSSDDRFYNSRIQFLREEIDEIDGRLMELIAARLESARKIGQLKNQNGVAFYQHDRWTEVLSHCKQLAEQLHINENFAVELFNLLHLTALDIQGE